MLFYDIRKVTGSKRLHFDEVQFIAGTEVKPTPRCDLTGQTIVVTCPTACNITSEVGLLGKLSQHEAKFNALLLHAHSKIFAYQW